jgi:hypothetical protein
VEIEISLEREVGYKSKSGEGCDGVGLGTIEAALGIVSAIAVTGVSSRYNEQGKIGVSVNGRSAG